MPLPSLETPSYELILPSTGKKIKFRPFLVKEYKILLTALESDAEEITRMVTELVDACTFNKLKIADLASFDIEYLFLNIRAKSIGEVANLTMKCEKCETQMDLEMDVTKAEVTKDKSHTSKIIITNEVGVEMRYPKFEEMLEIYQNFNSDKIVELICSCIKGVYTEKEYFGEFTKEEMIDFVNSFSKEQFEKIEKFFLTMPKVKQVLKSKCNNCGHDNETTLEGIQNFFV
jgi:hypothetical protein